MQSKDVALSCKVLGKMRLLKLPHRIAAPAALATTVGVLTEVPVMLFLVKIADRTKGRFPS